MPDENKISKARTFFKLSWIFILIAALIVGGIFYARWQENQDIEQKAAEKRREHAREVAEAFGGSSFDILSFYATPGIVSRGDSGNLCYGVSNAKEAAINPKPIDGVWPSLNRCVRIEPKKTTTYSLTITDAAGKKKTATVTVEVQ